MSRHHWSASGYSPCWPRHPVRADLELSGRCCTERTLHLGRSSRYSNSRCAAVIATNTKLGTMKNKTFISTDKLSPTKWKNVVDAAVAGRSRFIALAPASIKTAVTHEMAYFVHLKANHYAQSTPLAPYTLAEVKKITSFEKTQCGIKFA